MRKTTIYALIHFCIFFTLNLSPSISFAINQDSLLIEQNLQISDSLFKSGNPIDSIMKYLDKAERLSLEQENWERYAYTLFQKTGVYKEFRAYPQQGKYAVKAYQTAQKHIPRQHPLFVKILNQLSIYYSTEMNYASAIDYLDQAHAILQQMPDRFEKFEYLIANNLNRGFFLIQSGHAAEGEAYMKEGLKMAEEMSKKDMYFIHPVIYINQMLGRFNVEYKQYDKAIFHFTEALDIIDKVPGDFLPWPVTMNNFLVLCYLETNQMDKAIEALNRAESIQQLLISQTGRGIDQEITFRMRADWHSRRGEHENALALADSALKYGKLKYQHLKRHTLIGGLYNIYGTVYGRMGDWQHAVENFQLALIEQSDNFSNKDIYASPEKDDFSQVILETLKTLRLKSHGFERLYIQSNNQKDLEAAWESIALFDELCDRYRLNLQSESSQLVIANELKSAYEIGIGIGIKLFEVSQDQNYLLKAFALSEKSKAMSLFLSLNSANAKYEAGIPKETLVLEQILLGKLSFYRTKLHEERNAVRPDSLLIDNRETIVFELERSLDSLRTSFAKSYPSYFELKYEPKSINLPTIREKLSNNLLLEYFMGDSALYVFALRKKGIDYKVVENIDQVYPQIDTFIQSLHQTDRSKLIPLEDFKQNSYQLFSQLFDPAWAKDQPLLIIPDGQLGMLPFEILLKEQKGSHFSNLPYLFVEHPIHYAHSAQLLFNDPLKGRYRNASKTWGGFAPDFPGDKELKYNNQEVSEIGQLMKGHTFEGISASKAAFLQEAGEYKIIHLATHGYPNLEEPQFARLEFTQIDSLHDGILYAHELMHQELGAELVVLSACETGYGSIARGEGIMSLARSFRYAGVPSSVMSLWKAESSVSQQLMSSFYTHLQQGKAKDEALQQAKLEYLKNPIPGRLHPATWAHFVLIGDSSPIQQKSYWPWLMVLILALGLIAFLALKSKGHWLK